MPCYSAHQCFISRSESYGREEQFALVAIIPFISAADRVDAIANINAVLKGRDCSPKVGGMSGRSHQSVAHQYLDGSLFLDEVHALRWYTADVRNVADLVSFRTEEKSVGNIIFTVQDRKRGDL